LRSARSPRASLRAAARPQPVELGLHVGRAELAAVADALFLDAAPTAGCLRRPGPAAGEAAPVALDPPDEVGPALAGQPVEQRGEPPPPADPLTHRPPPRRQR